MVFKFSAKRKMVSILFPYLYHINVGSLEACSLKKFLQPSHLQSCKITFHNVKDGNGHELEEKQFDMKGTYSPAPMEDGRGAASPPTPPSVYVSGHNASWLTCTFVFINKVYLKLLVVAFFVFTVSVL